MCEFKQACGTVAAPAPVVEQNVEKPALPAASVTTWGEVKAKPIVLYFKVNSDQPLTNDVAQKLADIIAYMQQNPSAQVLLTGHTHIHKNAAYTNGLGLARAEAVKKVLVSMGAPASQVFTESKGQTQLFAQPNVPNSAWLNRRVVVSVIQ